MIKVKERDADFFVLNNVVEIGQDRPVCRVLDQTGRAINDEVVADDAVHQGLGKEQLETAQKTAKHIIFADQLEYGLLIGQ